MAVELSTAGEVQARPRLQIAFSFVAFVLIGANDGALGVLLPSLQSHYGVDKATIAFLFMASTAGYLSGAIATGPLSEALGARLFLALGAGLFVLGAGAFSLMLPFAVVVLCLVPLGFGVAIIDAGLNAYIARLPRNTALLNYLHAFYGLGALIGPAFAASVLALGWGWNNVYITWVACGFLMVVAFLAFFKREHPSHREAHSEESGNILFAALRLRLVWLAALFLLFYVGAEVSLGSWSFSYLTQERHQAELFSGWVVSGYWLGLTLGRLLLARVSARLGDRRLIELCLAGVAAGVLIAWLAPAEIAVVGLWLAGFSLGPIFPTTIAILSRLVPHRLISSAIGLVASFGSVGAAFFPWLAGNLAQSLGLWTLLPYAAILTVIMLGLWVALARDPAQHVVSQDRA